MWDGKNLYDLPKMNMNSFVLKLTILYFKMGLDVSQLLLGISGLAVGVAQLDLHLIEVILHFLLDSHGFILAACLRN